MTSRKKKQFIYGIGFIVFFTLIATGIFFAFVHEAPSCFDNVQNQNEEGIDCGGMCAQTCIGQPIELVAQPDVFAIDATHSSILAKIRNTNPNIAIPRFSYSFDMYGAGDVFLGTLHGESFLYASEVKYIFEPNASVSLEKITRIDFNTKIAETASPDTFQKPNVFVQSFQTAQESSQLTVRGSIFNQDKVPVSDVEIMAVFPGEFGQLTGASFTKLDLMSAGEQRNFTILYPYAEDVDVQNTQLFVFVRKP